MTAPDSKKEIIEIAAKWENITDGGYIGEGFTKCGIYVCNSFTP
jgi:hypothetical protein